jgi:MbtH protein
MSDQNDNAIYLTIVNDEGQYSIWPSENPIPAGWKAINSAGSRSECLAYIRELWTDMRPTALRIEMAARDAAA